MNNITSNFIYKDTYSLASEFERFMNKLPNPDELWNNAELKYGCCGKPISRELDIRNSMNCQHCLEKVQIKTASSRSFYNDGYVTEKVLYPVMIEKEYKKTEGGDFIVKEHNGDVEITDIAEYIKRVYPGIQCDKIEMVFKHQRIDTPVRFEIGLISNIRSVLFEGIPNSYNYTDERGTTNNFSLSEMDYLRELGLYNEFCDLLAFKQIFINEMLVKTLQAVVEKMQNAGMSLL